jgi:DNA-binding response OmpR family regulator
MRILVVEDDSQLADMLTEALTKRQYSVDIAKDGKLAWHRLEQFHYDLILLDVMLPELDGVSLCRQLRSHNSLLPVLMLTARDTVEDKIIGLDAGADDYVVKPFNLRELMARVRALLRRGGTAASTDLIWEKLHINPSTYEATYDGELLHLTPKEYALLELLVSGGRRVQSRMSIIKQIWSFDDPPSEDTVKSHIKGLRQKLKIAGASEDFIETVHSIGYRLKSPDI